MNNIVFFTITTLLILTKLTSMTNPSLGQGPSMNIKCEPCKLQEKQAPDTPLPEEQSSETIYESNNYTTKISTNILYNEWLTALETTDKVKLYWYFYNNLPILMRIFNNISGKDAFNDNEFIEGFNKLLQFSELTEKTNKPIGFYDHKKNKPTTEENKGIEHDLYRYSIVSSILGFIDPNSTPIENKLPGILINYGNHNYNEILKLNNKIKYSYIKVSDNFISFEGMLTRLLKKLENHVSKELLATVRQVNNLNTFLITILYRVVAKMNDKEKEICGIKCEPCTKNRNEFVDEIREFHKMMIFKNIWNKIFKAFNLGMIEFFINDEQQKSNLIKIIILFIGSFVNIHDLYDVNCDVGQDFEGSSYPVQMCPLSFTFGKYFEHNSKHESTHKKINSVCSEIKPDYNEYYEELNK